MPSQGEIDNNLRWLGVSAHPGAASNKAINLTVAFSASRLLPAVSNPYEIRRKTNHAKDDRLLWSRLLKLS